MKKKAARKPNGFGEFDRVMRGLVKVPKEAVADPPPAKTSKKK